MRALMIAAATFCILCLPDALLAQSPQASPERRFEVASVKPGLSPYELGRQAAQNGGAVQMPRMGIQTQPGGRFTAGSNLKQLIAEAFEVKDYQIDGGPSWLTTDYFDITALAGADAAPADIKAMLRTLLTERFGLRTHSDTRQAPVYVLTVARADGRLGPQLTRSTPECIEQVEQRKNGGAPPKPMTPAEREREMEILKRMASGGGMTTPRCGSSMMGSRANGGSTYAFGGMELQALVSRLSSELSAPVVDQTNLPGLFDVTLEFLSERTINGRPAGLDANSTESLPVTLTAALQQQLGLKLEKQIGPMPMVVVDAAARPTPD